MVHSLMRGFKKCITKSSSYADRKAPTERSKPRVLLDNPSTGDNNKSFLFLFSDHDSIPDTVPLVSLDADKEPLGSLFESPTASRYLGSSIVIHTIRLLKESTMLVDSGHEI